MAIKKWRTAQIGTLAVCGIGLAMLATNPDQSKYESYAVEQVGNRIKDECGKAPQGLGSIIQAPCRAFVDSNTDKIRPLIGGTTTRDNLMFFSIYKTDLSVPAFNVNVKIETIGLLGLFVTYKTP